jgi:hypothetical protein
MLTMEAEVNGDSTRTNYRGPSLVCSLGLSCQYKSFCRFLSDLAALVCPVQSAQLYSLAETPQPPLPSPPPVGLIYEGAIGQPR